MCEIYVKADPIKYESRSHSIRIHGVVTTVRLENEFWTLLGEMAQLEGVTTNQLIGTLYDEVTSFRGEFENFSSFLRVSCARYLALKKNPTMSRQPEPSTNRQPEPSANRQPEPTAIKPPESAPNLAVVAKRS